MDLGNGDGWWARSRGPCLSEQVFASLVGCPGQMDLGGKGAGWWRGKGGRGGWDERKCPSHQIPITVTSFGRPHWDMETWENQVIEHIPHFLANLDHASQWQISSCKRVHNLKMSFHNLSFLHKHIIAPIELITHSLQTNVVAKSKGFLSLRYINTFSRYIDWLKETFFGSDKIPDTLIDSNKLSRYIVVVHPFRLMGSLSRVSLWSCFVSFYLLQTICYLLTSLYLCKQYFIFPSFHLC